MGADRRDDTTPGSTTQEWARRSPDRANCHGRHVRLRHVRLDRFRQGPDREGPDHGAGQPGLRPLQPGRRRGDLGFQQPPGVRQLPPHPVDPGGVPLLVRAQVELVDQRHGLLAGGQGQAEDALGAGVVGDVVRRQASPRQPLQVLDDQAGVHQHHAVVGDQGRRLDHRIDRRERVVVAKHRHRLVRERQAQQPRRDGHAPHIGRIQHSDQSHRRSPEDPLPEGRGRGPCAAWEGEG